jgi:hypothetical protein
MPGIIKQWLKQLRRRRTYQQSGIKPRPTDDHKNCKPIDVRQPPPKAPRRSRRRVTHFFFELFNETLAAVPSQGRVFVFHLHPTCVYPFPETAEHQGSGNKYHTRKITANLEEGRRRGHYVEEERRVESLE